MLNTELKSLGVSPAPAWAIENSYETNENPGEDFINGGVCALLSDSQVDLTGDTPAWYTRIVYRILTTGGAERSAQFAVSFDPSYQRLEVHGIKAIRGDRVVDHARLDSLDLIRRETDLERRVLNGRLTATLIIPDIRPGDIIEQSWTIYGNNPALKGLYFNWVTLHDATPALARHHRVRAPKSRVIAEKIFGPPPEFTTEESDGIVDRRWSVKRASPLKFEPLMPPWRVLAPSIQFSEVQSWPQVSELFLNAYSAGSVPNDLAEEAAHINAAHPGDEKARAIAVLQTVQGRVRYLSLSLGEGGLIPRNLGEIWSTGYGDCKESSRLYAALAQLCGLDAVPALVSTNYGSALDTFLPSAGVFDHCIVRLRLADKTYWLDPTRKTRAISLDKIVPTLLGYALPLVPGAILEKMEMLPATLFVDVKEKIVFGPRVSSPATLQVRADYYALRADWIHEVFANQGHSNFSNMFKKRYQQDWASLEEEVPLRVEEAPQDDRVSVFVTYTIASPWKKAADKRVSCGIRDHDVANELAQMIPQPDRKEEIFLGIPHIMRRRIECEMPMAWPATPRINTPQIPGAKCKNILSVFGTVVEQSVELTIEAPTSPPGSAEGYRELVRVLHELSGLTFTGVASGDKFKAAARQRTWWSYWWIAWLIFMFLSFLARAVPPQPNPQPNEVPFRLTVPENPSPSSSSPLDSLPSPSDPKPE